MNNKLKKILLFVIISIALIALDQFSKYMASNYISKEIIFIEDFFSFRLEYNEGAAFSSFSDYPILLKLISAIASVVVAIYYFAGKHDRLTSIGLIMLFSGAVGNGIDRIFRGVVVDFINFNIFKPFNGNFAIFNIADLLITFGCAFVIIAILFSKEEKKDGN